MMNNEENQPRENEHPQKPPDPIREPPPRRAPELGRPPPHVAEEPTPLPRPPSPTTTTDSESLRSNLRSSIRIPTAAYSGGGLQNPHLGSCGGVGEWALSPSLYSAGGGGGGGVVVGGGERGGRSSGREEVEDAIQTLGFRGSSAMGGGDWGLGRRRGGEWRGIDTGEKRSIHRDDDVKGQRRTGSLSLDSRFPWAGPTRSAKNHSVHTGCMRISHALLTPLAPN